MISIQTEDFDLGREQAELRIAAGDAGAIVTFTGLVREVYDQTASEGGSESKNESVVALTLEHYPGMTEKCLQDIADQARVAFDSMHPVASTMMELGAVLLILAVLAGAMAAVQPRSEEAP